MTHDEGSVYRLISPNTDKVYIGSCIRTLKQRLSLHIRNKDRSNITSKIIIDAGDADIELIEQVFFTDIAELREREKHHIQNTPNCVNKRNRYKTLKEVQSAYRKGKQEALNAYSRARRAEQRQLDPLPPLLTEEQLKANRKAYREAHRDDKKEYDKQYRATLSAQTIVCACGGSYLPKHKTTHFKTKLHKNGSSEPTCERFS